MSARAPGVAVVIAAKDSAATVARAVASALAQAEVAQVIVVDDGSADGTAAAAACAGDGSGRLVVERLPANRGPSAARNHALFLVRAEHFAILDSDDFILPGRFARLLALGADIAADDMLFVGEGTDLDSLTAPRTRARTRAIDLQGFVDGCVHRGSRTRSQLGFLKPVIRTALLPEAPVYDERVRLGEDFLLYAELLRRGARFVLAEAPGYVAVERPTSLSARHDAADLLALLMAEEELAARLAPDDPAAGAMARRLAETRDKHALRAFLALRRARGAAPALAALARRPAQWRAVGGGVLRDKLSALTARRAVPAAAPAPRLLLGPDWPGWDAAGG